MKKFIIYDSAPFSGHIRFMGEVDMNQPSDGSTLKEHIDKLLLKYPAAALHLYDGDLPDKEVVKFDPVGKTFVPLDTGDITPAQLIKNKQKLKNQEISANVSDWTVVEAEIKSAFPDPAQQAVLLKQAKTVYWLADDI